MRIMIINIIIITIKIIILKTKVLYEQPNPMAMFVRSEALYNMCEVTDITMELREALENRFWGFYQILPSSVTKFYSVCVWGRGSTGLRLSEFAQISDFFQF